MALETLKDVKEIGGFEVKEVTWTTPKGNHIEINHLGNAITFKIQKGTVKENGVNGCQVDTIIETAKIILEGLNKNFPSGYNDTAIHGLNVALNALKLRTLDRQERGVEGFKKD